MKAQLTIGAAVAAAMVAMPAGAGAGEPAQVAAKGSPKVDQMVVFRSGKVVSGRVLAKRTTVKIGKRTCAVAAATPLAALLRSKPGPIAFHDYGSCSSRPVDSAGLFVKAIRGERNRGLDGWVYKVGRKLATAGAADPGGPFGSGRLRSGREVVWFYCRQGDSGSCQRSLELTTAVDGSRLTVTVTGYDDSGKGAPAAGATVRVGNQRAKTGPDGEVALLTLGRGRHTVVATKRGAIRSFPRRVTIR